MQVQLNGSMYSLLKVQQVQKVNRVHLERKGKRESPGQKGADAVINKLNKVDALTADSATTQQIATAFNNLIADLKAKGYMNQG